MDITKQTIKDALGFTTDVEVAEFLGCTKQNVGHWGDDQPIPEMRQWQAIALRPDLFGDAAEALKKTA